MTKYRIIIKFPQVWQQIELLPSFLKYICIAKFPQVWQMLELLQISSGMAKDRIISKFTQVGQKIELLPSFLGYCLSGFVLINLYSNSFHYLFFL
jgi:hypothetical protein